MLGHSPTLHGNVWKYVVIIGNVLKRSENDLLKFNEMHHSEKEEIQINRPLD